MTINEIIKYGLELFRGRIGVKNWIFGVFFLNVICFFLGVFFVMVLGGIKILLPLTILVSIPFSIVCLSLSIRRLHDKGKSAWFLLLFFIPFVNLFLSLYLLTKGDKDANQYGEPVSSDVKFFEDILKIRI